MVRKIAVVAALALVGAVVATVGVGAHRAFGYIGVTLGLLLVATAGVFARTWGRWPGFAAYALAWVALTTVYGQVGPGNSILIATEVGGVADPRGAIWTYGGALVLVLVALVPTRWLEGRDDFEVPNPGATEVREGRDVTEGRNVEA